MQQPDILCNLLVGEVEGVSDQKNDEYESDYTSNAITRKKHVI